LRLLLHGIREQPHDPFTLSTWARPIEHGRAGRCVALLRREHRTLRICGLNCPKLYYLVVQCHRQLEQRAEAFAACTAGRNIYPLDAELLSLEGELRQESNDPAGAEACFLSLRHTREPITSTASRSACTAFSRGTSSLCSTAARVVTPKQSTLAHGHP